MSAPIQQVNATAYTVPTEQPESDGTLEWDATTLVVVHVSAADQVGLGYSYASRSAAELIRERLAGVVCGLDALDITAAWERMRASVRNLGQAGVAASAQSAVDIALWDLKARLLHLPLVKLLGAVRPSVTAYGSGGFTSYPLERLDEQLRGWVADGLTAVKMKIGRSPEQDLSRVRAAREAVRPEADLMVDANGAFYAREAVRQAEAWGDCDVMWFEEPVPAWDFVGTRFVRDHAPSHIAIAGGEYGYELEYYQRLLTLGAVDVVQADATRCGGITGFLRVGALCEAFGVPVSAHTAPSVHVHPCCALTRARSAEYFHDHVRLEHQLFDGAATADRGQLRPDLSRPGLGLEFKQADAERYRVFP